MAELIYTAITSLDGYIEDAEGKFDWPRPTRRCTPSLRSMPLVAKGR